MSITVKIPFEDPAQYLFDTSTVEIADGVGKLKSLAPSGEVYYYNFKDDASLLSERGGSSFTLPDYNASNPNTGSVVGGELLLNNKDFSYAYIPTVTNPVPAELSFKTRFTVPLSFSVAHEAISIKGADNSRLIMRLLWLGSGLFRVYINLNNGAGTQIYSQIIGGNLPIAVEYDVSVSMNASEINLYLDGNLEYTQNISAHTFDFSTLTTTLGGKYPDRSAFNMSDLQVTGGHIYTGATVTTGEQFTYEKSPQQLIATAPMLMDSFISFTRTETIINESDVTHQLMLNSEYWWYNTVTSKWEQVVDFVTDVNTGPEMAANVDKLNLVDGIGKYVQIVTYIKSPDGYYNPECKTIDLIYRFYFGLGSGLPTCIVYGGIVDSSGNEVSGAKITVSGNDFLHGETYVTRNTEFTTGSNGKWDVEIVETATVSKEATITISYSDIDGD